MRDLDGDGRIGVDDLPPRTARERAAAGGAIATRTQTQGQAKDGKEAGKDAKERGRFTPASACSAASDRQFGRLDKNGDGFIDAKDLEPLAAERVAFASKRFFRRFDADGDGKVTKDEFNRFAKERFADLDVDGDGRITDADLPPMMRGRGILK